MLGMAIWSISCPYTSSKKEYGMTSSSRSLVNTETVMKSLATGPLMNV